MCCTQGAKHVGISKREDLQSAIQRARLAREVRDLEADLRALQLDITSGKPSNTPPAAPVSQLPGATPPVPPQTTADQTPPPPVQTTADQTPPPPVQITADQTPPPPAQEQVATTSDGTKLLISMGEKKPALKNVSVSQWAITNTKIISSRWARGTHGLLCWNSTGSTAHCKLSLSLAEIAKGQRETTQGRGETGYIQGVMTSPSTIKIYHDRAKKGIVYLDATGNVIGQKVGRKPYYAYKPVVNHSKKGQMPMPCATLVTTTTVYLT
uniref:Uncharacterized protein n=1 Tax=Branchiostoma floridae TaxID=7739 RepID=C3Y872_BRAFL|eukprot:XP_002607531.1 hypothetical protein BRAFLDRAFT_106479 [Branchiostoma floridae]